MNRTPRHRGQAGKGFRAPGLSPGCAGSCWQSRGSVVAGFAALSQMMVLKWCKKKKNPWDLRAKNEIGIVTHSPKYPQGVLKIHEKSPKFGGEFSRVLGCRAVGLGLSQLLLALCPLCSTEGQTSPHSRLGPAWQRFLIPWPPQIPGNATACHSWSRNPKSQITDSFPLLSPNDSLTD